MYSVEWNSSTDLMRGRNDTPSARPRLYFNMYNVCEHAPQKLRLFLLITHSYFDALRAHPVQRDLYSKRIDASLARMNIVNGRREGLVLLALVGAKREHIVNAGAVCPRFCLGHEGSYCTAHCF